MKKNFQRLAITILLFTATVLPAHAQQFSVLPQAKDASGNLMTFGNCKALMSKFESQADQSSMLKAGTDRDNTLGCAIMTGEITFSMIPYYITYITNFLLGLAALISVLFIVIGGYRYVIGGLTDDKEKGKNTIRDALMGLAVAILAWTIVSVIINAVTG